MTENVFLKFALLFGLCSTFFISCSKPDDPPSEKTFEMTEVFVSDPMPQNADYSPRVVGDKLLYYGNQYVYLQSFIKKTRTIFEIPDQVHLLNKNQYDVSYTGTDGKYIWYFDVDQSKWRHLYTAPDSVAIEQDFELEIHQNRIIFVQKVLASNRKMIYQLDLETNEVVYLQAFSDQIASEMLRLQDQPKLTRSSENEWLLSALLYTTGTINGHILLTYNLTTGEEQSRLDLGGLSYQELKVVDNYILVVAPAYFSDAASLVNPVDGSKKWYVSSGEFHIFENYLFIINWFGSGSVALETGVGSGTLPAGSIAGSATASFDNYITMISKTESGESNRPANQVVIANVNNGNEAMRAYLPGSLNVTGEVMYYPDSNYIAVQDMARKFHVMKLK